MRSLAFFLSLLLTTAAHASDWTVTRRADAETIAPQVEYLRIDTENAASDRRVTLHLVHFHGPRATLKIVDQGGGDPGRYRNVEEAMQKNFCIAGCNGGFFHPDFRPSGLVIADGERINKFEQASLLSGVLLVDDAGPKILRRAEFRDHAGITQLLQSGPFLVDHGKTVAGLSTSKARKRTFVLTGKGADGQPHWILGLATATSLADLGIILADRDIVTALDVHRALNLDGGSSSALYFDRGAGNKPFHYRGLKWVRNYVGVTLR